MTHLNALKSKVPTAALTLARTQSRGAAIELCRASLRVARAAGTAQSDVAAIYREIAASALRGARLTA